MARRNRFAGHRDGTLLAYTKRIAGSDPEAWQPHPSGHLILNFFQSSRESHFPEPYLDV